MRGDLDVKLGLRGASGIPNVRRSTLRELIMFQAIHRSLLRIRSLGISASSLSSRMDSYPYNRSVLCKEAAFIGSNALRNDLTDLDSLILALTTTSPYTSRFRHSSIP